ncbi:trichohyalin [Ooceraea biroi]|uniref:trichohyalin n=1 Tax=Ooceraea biroi TaxID=2015173 RepID=UPI000F08B1CB|nr:trichohyalin [Ooceraea biroi]
MVQFDEARKLMDEMMKVAIFQPFETRRMLEDERRNFVDPNLVMDARHRIFRENLYSSPARPVLTDTKKLLTQEEMRELQLKREEAIVERELRKFEQDLQKSRPKFCEPCSRKNIANSDDENFWRTSSRIKQAVINKRRENRGKTSEHKQTTIRKRNGQVESPSTEFKDTRRECSITEIEGSFGNIKVTIKDKPSCESKNRLCVLRSCFRALQENARHKQRLREIKTNIQSTAIRRNLRRCIRVWKTHVENAKKARQNAVEDSDACKIEMFIDIIAETQKELTKCRRAESKAPSATSGKDAEARKRTPSRPFVVESPAQSRLNAQKEIIRKQKIKLAEQSKIIEELKLKQVQEEITRSGEETIDVAKETLTHCGQQTRRTLIQLMRQAGYRDKSLTAPVRVPSPPRFLTRMEARAEARKNRIKLREEMRQRKLEDERRKEEIARREEEQERRRSQQEALREARRLREEREQQRAREIERCKRLNAMADVFYRKHLLRRYIMEPFIALVEMKNDRMSKAKDHYERCLLREAFVRWKMETEHQNQIRTELAVTLYNRNLLWYALREWREAAKEARRQEQVARDFSDMRLQSKCFTLWKIRTMEYKAERLKNERLAREHYEERLRSRYFNMWKRYPKIVPDIKESERIRNTWREIVQEVIPDFDPRQRGVILED